MKIVAPGLVLFDMGEFVHQVDRRGFKCSGFGRGECGNWIGWEVYVATKCCASNALKGKILVCSIENLDRFVMNQIAVNGKEEEILLRGACDACGMHQHQIICNFRTQDFETL